MPHLTPQQRTKRINAALDRKYPLIGEHFHTTPEAEERKLARYDEAEKRRLEHFAKFHRECFGRAAEHIALLIEHLGEEHVNEIAEAREPAAKIFPCLNTAVYVSDFWFNQVRKFHQAE